MKKNIIIFFTLIVVIFGVNDIYAHEKQSTFDILVPRSHNPAFVEPGDEFTIELRDIKGLTSKGKWSVILKNDLRTWKCIVKEVIKERIHHGTEDGWVLTIKTPSGIPPELMGLEIHHSSGKEGKSFRSVSIVPDFEQDFYIFHQSDEHITSDLAVEPGGKSSTKWGNGSKEALKWLTLILNLTNPRFVLHTGDNMQLYNEPNNWCGMEEAKIRVKRFLDGLADYAVPTILVTGNHDIGFSKYIQNSEWRDVYEHLVGQTAFSFKMGSFYVLGSEWTNTKYLKWAKADFLATFADSSVKYRLLASHFYDGLNGWTTIATADNPPDLLLVGHNHRTRTLQTTPYYALSVGTAQNHQRAAFFDFKRTSQGWSSSQPALHADEINVHKLVGDNGAPTVSAIYSVANDGTVKSNSVSISNKLPHDFYNGRIRFLMQKGNYAVKGGEIISQYDYAKGKKTTVIVKVNIKSNGVTDVSIKNK